MAQADCVYLNANEHPKAVREVPTRDARFATWCRQQYPTHQYKRLAPLLHQLRVVKSAPELGLIRQACQITAAGIKAVLPSIKPGTMEYEIEAALSKEFIQRRSRGFAYLPIIAAGASACVLHYTTNHQACQAGEVLLLDVGAEYAHYRADVTQVVPVGGRGIEVTRAAQLCCRQQGLHIALSARFDVLTISSFIIVSWLQDAH